MKKALIVFVSILVGIYLVFSLVDTSDYKLEKRLFRVEKQLQEIAKDPKAAPVKKFDDIILQYQTIIKAYPKSKISRRLYLQIGFAYSLKGDYDKAIESYEQVLTLFPEDKDLCASALISVGGLYESKEDPVKALEVYQKILQDYPYTDIGLNMPMYIANYYLKLENQSEYRRALREGIAFYKKVSEKMPDSSKEFNALRLLVTAYYSQENWRAAVNTLGDILINYAEPPYLTPQRADLIVRSINTVSAVRMKNYDLPISIYERFVKEHPNHAIKGILVDMITALKKLKEGGVVVEPKKK